MDPGKWPERKPKLTKGKLLQSTAMSFGVEEELEDEFQRNPTTVDGKELPSDRIHGNRIHKGGEETTTLAKDLLNTNSARTDGVWEKLHEVGCTHVNQACLGTIKK
jgi:hypothetical protein